jgi:hypothetical protein
VSRRRGLGTGGGRRRCSDGPNRRGRCGRCAGDDGELVRLIYGVGFVPRRSRRVTGGVLAAAFSSCWAMMLFCNEMDGEKWSGGSAEMRGGLGYQKEVAGSPGRVGIDDGRRQYCGAPACNLRSLAA